MFLDFFEWTNYNIFEETKHKYMFDIFLYFFLIYTFNRAFFWRSTQYFKPPLLSYLTPFFHHLIRAVSCSGVGDSRTCSHANDLNNFDNLTTDRTIDLELSSNCAKYKNPL